MTDIDETLSFSHELLSLTVFSAGTEIAFARKLNFIGATGANPTIAAVYNSTTKAIDVTVTGVALSGATPTAVAATGTGGEAATASKSDHRHGAEARAVILIDESDSPYTVTNTYCLIIVDTSVNDVDIMLPSAAISTSREIEILHAVAGNTLTITPTGGDTLLPGTFISTGVLSAYKLRPNGSTTWYYVGGWQP